MLKDIYGNNKGYIPLNINKYLFYNIFSEFKGKSVNRCILVENILSLLDYCTQKSLSRQAEDHGFYLPSRLLRKILGHQRDRMILKVLCDYGVLKRVSEYRVGFHSRRYEFCDGVMRGGYRTINMRRPSFFGRGVEYRIEAILDSADLLVQKTGENLAKMSLPRFEEVDTHDLSGEQAACWRYLLEKFHAGEYYVIRDQYGRLHSTLTNLPSKLREQITVRGEPLACADVSSCFPTLLSKNIRNQNERLKYLSWIQSGRFYENLMFIVGEPEADRANFKVEFNSWINGKKVANVQIAMAKAFPQLTGDLNGMRHPEYRQLGYELMKLESQIMLDDVFRLFLTTCPDAFALSLHDAIYTTEKHLPLVSGLLSVSFRNELGFPPNIKTEVCGRRPLAEAA